ncbi:MAG: PhzF family phenazine biosynthesis protein [Xanthomonadaceae bacterium]|nr:PhzF family phenazine biosynthesis protein [Xanthomonadaceae bacterium]
MSTRRFLQLDVFTDRPGAGNPLAVVVEADGLDDEAMQAFAHWTNLSETIFLFPPDIEQANYRVRIFTPRSELPFAGHPSIGAAWAVLETGLTTAPEGRLIQQCDAGLLPVWIEEREGIRVIHVRSPSARRREVVGPDWLSADALFGARRGSLPPALWDNGPNWWLVELADEQSVRGLSPDLAAIASLPGTMQSPGGKLAVFARCHEATDYQLVVRAFAPAQGIPEDPVTGSANACIAAMLHRAGRLPGTGNRYIAHQGREIGRDGKVEITVDADGEVWIGGQVQTVIRGEMDWP